MAATFDPGDKMRRVDARLVNPRDILAAIGALMLEESQEAFKAQRFGTKPWDKRKVPNVFGIIADFSQGDTKSPPKRRFEPEPALIDKGVTGLLGSLTFKLEGTHAVAVGSWMKYAGKHHRGEETESLPITAQVQARLWKWLKRQPKERRAQLGWLLNKKFTNTTLRMKLPERPIVGITKRTVAAVREVLGVRLLEVRGRIR